MVLDEALDGKNALERVEEQRKIAAAAKKLEKDAKVKEMKQRMLERETEEA
jgi:hypothetical protein